MLVGDHNLTTGSDTPYAQAYIIAQFLSHPGFTTQPVSNDIALIRTLQPIQFNEAVGPVCLPWKYRSNNFNGATVEACGWGDLDFGGPKSDVLNKVALNVISNQECSSRLNSTITHQKMCTYTPTKDTCQVGLVLVGLTLSFFGGFAADFFIVSTFVFFFVFVLVRFRWTTFLYRASEWAGLRGWHCELWVCLCNEKSQC